MTPLPACTSKKLFFTLSLLPFSKLSFTGKEKGRERCCCFHGEVLAAREGM